MKIRKLEKYIWLKICPILYKFSPEVASKILFLFSKKQRLNLKEPKTFNEKIQWLKLYWQDPRVSKCADKYEVRKYAEEMGLVEILNPLYGVYDNVKNIDFENLPNKFALKCSHGCGYNIICKCKDDLNIDEVKEKVNKWMKSRYAHVAAEVQYDRIKPRIIVEEYIKGINGHPPIDYKLFCFNGKVNFTMVCEGRGEAEYPQFNFYDNDWNVLHYYNNLNQINLNNRKHYLEKPESFKKMKEYAEKLSLQFPFVRVDFYEINEKPILGEMTFTPTGGIDSFFDKNTDLLLGNLIKLPAKYIN